MQQEHMEMKSKRVCKVEGSSLDIISTLPQTILETILCLLPTKEAARTSILAREWRYKWTKLPKLEFRMDDMSKRINNKKQGQGGSTDRRCELFNKLHQILLLHQGPIQDFTLDANPWRRSYNPFGFDQILLYLSKNHTLKKLTLFGWEVSVRYRLPLRVFSFHHLTDLYLYCVDLDDVPILNGFSSLRSLVLDHVWISSENRLHLLSNCPSLKSLDLLTGDGHIGGKGCTIIELFECLPVIERLTIRTDFFQWLVLDSVAKKSPPSLFHLKYFSFKDVCFHDDYGLAFLLVLIKYSPNLEKIKLEIDGGHQCYWEYSVVWEEYSDVLLEHLTELEIENFENSKHEMEFVKFILARSPKLKKVRIKSWVVKKDRTEILQALLCAPRASQVLIYVSELL